MRLRVGLVRTRGDTRLGNSVVCSAFSAGSAVPTFVPCAVVEKVFSNFLRGTRSLGVLDVWDRSLCSARRCRETSQASRSVSQPGAPVKSVVLYPTHSEANLRPGP